MTKRSFFLFSGVVGVVIIVSTLWIFRTPLVDIFRQSKTSSIEIQKPSQGIKRKVSYLGRIREAQRLIEHEYYSLATIELSTALKEKPDILQPYLLLGEIYIRNQDTQKLNNLILELKNRFPSDPSVAVLDGRRLIAEKKFAEAVHILSTLEEEIPPALKWYYALLLGLQNDHEKAKKILTELKKVPVDEQKLVVSEKGIESKNVEKNQSLTPEEYQKVEDILTTYKTFDTLSEGKQPHLFATLSKSLAQNNEAVLAFEYAERAIKEDIHYIDAWILRGYANMLLKKNDEALADLRHAYDMDPIRPQTHYFLALALHENGNDDEAILFFEKSLEHNFEFTNEVQWKLIELFTAQKKYEKVLTLYQELLDETVAEHHYVSALHTAIDIVKKPKFALEFSERLLSEKSNDDFALNMHGWALIANKKFIQAEEILTKAQKVNSENPRTYLNLGLLYEEQAKFNEAKEFYKKSYDLGKDAPSNIIVNLAADKYNQLLSQIEKPEEPEAPINPKNSP
jgi:tetratricopeptide (TPR) repeat protein